ncbi:MAG: leucine-rich repeat domain-containing protein [Muribaculaceae bacterium]|nr:leucine-rich repeat domain-containing protein [Muribaculaceae bacterium]
MKIFYTLAVAIAALAAPAMAITPGSPSVSMSFEIDNNTGKVVGTLTAPTKDSEWQTLPDDVRMDITVTRSCYSLSESDIPIASFSNMAPGESVQFTDEATPAWQYGYDYTYTPVACIGTERNPYSYGGMVTPGLQFYFAYQSFTATPAADGNSVELSAVVPSTLANGQPLPVPVKALEFYRDYQGNELVERVENPETGATVTVTDTHPHENTTSTYMVRAVTDFGSAQSTAQCFVGFDVPYSPYPVNAEYCEEGIRIYWTAPDRGAHWGNIDPEKTVYNVFRCWGVGENNRELIAQFIKETEFVDNGEGMEFPRAVRYEVQALNNVGPGESNYSSYDYSLIIGPEYQLPFAETFDGGADKMWTYVNSSYYARMYVAEEADYDDGTVVKPHSGSGLIYVNYAEYGAKSGSTNSMTSYKIDLAETTAPVLSYWYYAIPGNDVYIDAQLSTDGTDFTSLSKTLISLDAETPGWKKVMLPLPDYTDKNPVYLRLVTGFTDIASSAIIDDIVIADYRSVGKITAESDTETRTITLSWTDPGTEYTPCIGFTGYVDGESVGSVTSPWVFDAPEYDTTYSFSIEALYEGVQVAPSASVTAEVKAPEITEFTIDDYTFLIDKEQFEPTVWIKEYTGNRTFLTVPGSVYYNEVSYVVTRILEGAFRGNEKMASVVIPQSITTIGKEAFAECPTLMAATIGAGVTEIESRAFADCGALAQVIFMPTVPPAVADDAFEGIAAGCKGTAPEGTAELYAAVEGLRGIDFGTSGIAGISLDGVAEVEYFDLNGARMASPTQGRTVIVRVTANDGTVSTFKTIIR